MDDGDDEAGKPFLLLRYNDQQEKEDSDDGNDGEQRMSRRSGSIHYVQYEGVLVRRGSVGSERVAAVR